MCVIFFQVVSNCSYFYICVHIRFSEVTVLPSTKEKKSCSSMPEKYCSVALQRKWSAEQHGLIYIFFLYGSIRSTTSF